MAQKPPEPEPPEPELPESEPPEFRPFLKELENEFAGN